MQGEAEHHRQRNPAHAQEARIVKLALESFADILENQLGFKDDGVPISDNYVTAHGAWCSR